ncbi:CAP domain-containing protein [Sulfitobacter donghicola]|uniref:Membrane protein n=1 Tax=Sulfitobacter donghicola DSW-25 = KCTC 12864 = JCM 14565 TaxID=1300350 RepID=A0A073IWY4_9RHOB|nr:CAP domain-containing protein [Sulfitobacter donghicola]KEJ89892.1 membrane protein [Sulfitobacter donghicola DSW-25 = KCTC 12864 = JCM 14565]KIN66983.1 Allergen V5/Tpx-1 related protein [Sulfitobacter donghicola DSW-25 = KCTC 12864 = JCM 14565]
MKSLAIIGAICFALSGCVVVSSSGSAPAAQQASANSGPVAAGSAGAQINAIRARVGLGGLQRNARLDAIARVHAQDMAKNKFFAHQGSDGSTAGKRATRGGYRWCTIGENISKGYSSQARTIEGWRTSPGHYRNMVNNKAQHFGMAKVGEYWVMLVAAKNC